MSETTQEEIRWLQSQHDNALGLIRMRGVPESRAKYLPQALDVLLTRLDREIQALRGGTKMAEDRLAAIESQVLWWTGDMPVTAKAWEKVGGECWWVMHQDDVARASFAPDLRPDEPGPLFLPILDPEGS